MMCEFKAVCDWPGCGRLYPGVYYGSMDMFDVLNNPDWLTLYGGRDGDRAFHFCSRHIRYDRDPDGLPFAAEFDPDDEHYQLVNGELLAYYLDGCTTQPLPEPECEDTILAMLKGRA